MRRGGWAPLCSTAPVCCRGLLEQDPACVCYLHCGVGVAARTCRCQSSLSCFTASLAAMGTADKERRWLLSLSLPIIASTCMQSCRHLVNASRIKSLFCASSRAQWPDSRRLSPATSSPPGGADAGSSELFHLCSGLVSSGWWAEGFPVSLCFKLIWKSPIPCFGFGTVVNMSPASAATASESSATTVPEEETESPREEVRTSYLHCAGQLLYTEAWGG